MIGSYSSIFTLGHKAVLDIFEDDVVVEEKIDGSQFSFKVDSNGELFCRSKGRQINIYGPDGLFAGAVNTAIALKNTIKPDWTYRGEVLCKPHHNNLNYSRKPKGDIILFDVDAGFENYICRKDKEDEANRLGLEIVPVFFSGKVKSLEQLMAFLENDSYLGGTKIEGFVVKNYFRFTPDKKAMMAKYVSEAYKEVAKTFNKEPGKPRYDIMGTLIEMYKTEQRWDKCIQHLRDDGKLLDEPKDIGLLIKEVPADVLKEEEDSIKTILFRQFWPMLSRALVSGLPEYYKKKLAEKQFYKFDDEEKKS